MNGKEKIEKALKLVNDKIEHLTPHEELTKEEYEHICLTLKKIKKILEADEDDGWVPGVVGERTDSKGNKY